MECPGEDPHLTSVYAYNYVTGMQVWVATGICHWICHWHMQPLDMQQQPNQPLQPPPPRGWH